MVKENSIIVKHEDIYDKNGNVEIKILNDVKLTPKQTKNLSDFAKAKYPVIKQMILKLQEGALEDDENFFNEHSRKRGFFKKEILLYCNDKIYTKEQYLKEQQRRRLKQLEEIKITTETEILPAVNLDGKSEKEKKRFFNELANKKLEFH